jgi:hypothetical protein
MAEKKEANTGYFWLAACEHQNNNPNALLTELYCVVEGAFR